MAKPPLTAETTALLTEIVPTKGAIYTARTDAAYANVEPLHDWVHAIEDEITAVERLLRAAIRTESSPFATPFFERLKMTLAAMRTHAKDLLATMDSLTDDLVQLDRYAQDIDTSLETSDARNATEATHVVVSIAELANLRERADAGDVARIALLQPQVSVGASDAG